MRKILGFAVLAIVAWFVLKIFFGILGSLIGLGIWILGLAVVGYLVYLVLRVIAPGVADKIKGTLSGSHSSAPFDDRMPR